MILRISIGWRNAPLPVLVRPRKQSPVIIEPAPVIAAEAVLH